MPSHARLQHVWLTVLLLSFTASASSPPLAIGRALAAPRSGLAGSWAGDITTTVAYSPFPLLLVIRDSEDGPVGTGGPSSREQYPLQDLRFQDGRLRCALETKQELRFTFDLVLSDRRLEGTADAVDRGHSWRGRVTLDRETIETAAARRTGGTHAR